jgi:hypothetical protein
MKPGPIRVSVTKRTEIDLQSLSVTAPERSPVTTVALQGRPERDRERAPRCAAGGHFLQADPLLTRLTSSRKPRTELRLSLAGSETS